METFMAVLFVLGLVLPPLAVVGGAVSLIIARLSVYWRSNVTNYGRVAGRRALRHP